MLLHFKKYVYFCMELPIQHLENGHRGVFFMANENSRLAEMTYVWSGDSRIIIDHTEVNEVLKGSGAGKKLVAAGAAFARKKGIKIIPLCPFAKAVMQKDPTYHDLL